MIQIALATGEQLTIMQHFLQASHLPLAGLERDLWRAWLAWKDETPIACAGLERYGKRALLRSVAVAPTWRQQGIGSQLVRTVVQEAQALGIQEIYLLTEGAEAFFKRLGFQPIARENVPAALHASAEWNGACPQTATVMVLRCG
ncbi:arsenic resistance N-acetyltransferase ArsN2 [Thermogemmatispora sp.]|uniref:arsenic resistance N-acetyltransferase ArsN2 n=1 Tax=Thermogemmatispora sp. TaxID=1968838 RepID=UPI002ACBEDF5|nr:arsenic resistance N-acetyltransferase ArsN2 [Thermogemmatispora sp.]